MFQSIIDFLMAFGIWGLFIHSFVDAIIFPIPAFFSQVPLSMMNPSSAIWLATAGYIASLLGTPFGFLIGKVLGQSVLYKILKKRWIDKVSEMFHKNGEAAILVGAFTPIPFKVFTILAGCLNYSIWKLIGYASLGRAAKFYVVGILFYVYGRAAASMIDNLQYIFMAIGIAIGLIFVTVMRMRNKRIRREKGQEVNVQEVKGQEVKNSGSISQ